MRTKKPEITELDRMLALIPSDARDVESIPDVSAVSAVEAAECLAAYYTRRAREIAESDLGRKERTRGLILIGALSSQLPEATREQYRDLFAQLSPRDMACVRAIDWARNVLDSSRDA